MPFFYDLLAFAYSKNMDKEQKKVLIPMHLYKLV